MDGTGLLLVFLLCVLIKPVEMASAMRWMASVASSAYVIDVKSSKTNGESKPKDSIMAM